VRRQSKLQTKGNQRATTMTERNFALWYRLNDGSTFLHRRASEEQQRNCPCHCHKEPFEGEKIIVACSHCEPWENPEADLLLDEKIRTVLLRVYQNASLGDRDTLIAAATQKIRDIIDEETQRARESKS
jgi:hypothetical protein